MPARFTFEGRSRKFRMRSPKPGSELVFVTSFRTGTDRNVQRRGFGKGFGRPVFVKEINAQTGDVVLVFDEEKLFRNSLRASGINWLMKEYSARENFRAKVQIRYRQKAVDAEIIPSRSNPTEAEVIFEIPQRAVTLGQAVVFYENDTVIGGGWIG